MSTSKLQQLTFVGPAPRRYTKTDSTSTATLTTEEVVPSASGTDPGLLTEAQESHALFHVDYDTNHNKGYSAFFAQDSGGTSGRSSLPLTSVPGRLAIQLITSHISAGTSTYRWSTDTIANGPTNAIRVQTENTSSVLTEYPGVALWFQKTGGNYALATGTNAFTEREDWGSLGGITYSESSRVIRIADPGLYCVSLLANPDETGSNSYSRADIRLVNPSDTNEVYASVVSTSTTLSPFLSCTGHIYVSTVAKEVDVLAKFTGFSGTTATGFSILINKIHST